MTGLINPADFTVIVGRRINDPEAGDVVELGSWERQSDGSWERAS